MRTPPATIPHAGFARLFLPRVASRAIAPPILIKAISAEAAVDGFGELQHGTEPLARAGRDALVGFRLRQALPQHCERRIDLARFPALSDAPHHLEHVGLSLVVVSPVAHRMHAADEAPAQ